jgi:POT family proton-dependent oligopeptide transporter
MGIDLKGVLDKTVTPDASQMKLLTDANIPTTYPVFAGFQIHNLYEFFMVFVILPGTAGTHSSSAHQMAQEDDAWSEVI